MKISELPQEVKAKALEYQKNDRSPFCNKESDDLNDAFGWDYTEEGYDYWNKWYDEKIIPKTPQHYDNSKGSIYKFCEEQGLNSYEFDLIKRVVRCRKKGQFKEDLEKTKVLIDLYLNEYEK